MRGERPRSRVRGMAGAALMLLAFGPADMSVADEFRAAERHQMVEEIETVARIAAETGRPVLDARVLAAMRKVPRHEFVPGEQKRAAYRNRPLPIGEGQTISQPYIVALMTDLLELPPGAKVLEIGTGCGYQAAVLAEIADEVHSIEIVDSLGRKAAATLARLGHANVKTRIGDGYLGWPEAAPFDAIIVTAAPDHIPAGAARAAQARRTHGHSGRHAVAGVDGRAQSGRRLDAERDDRAGALRAADARERE